MYRVSQKMFISKKGEQLTNEHFLGHLVFRLLAFIPLRFFNQKLQDKSIIKLNNWLNLIDSFPGSSQLQQLGLAQLVVYHFKTMVFRIYHS